MNIILVSSRLNTARTLTITRFHLVSAAFVLSALVTGLAAAINYAALQYAAETRSNFLLSLSNLTRAPAARSDRDPDYLRKNLDAMAVRLGQLQAQMLRLDTLGERVARLAGFNPREFLFDEPPARGGSFEEAASTPVSFAELGRYIDVLSRQADDRSDSLGLLESMLTYDGARRKLLPSVLPVEGGAYNSNFGMRIDPFSGRRAFHQGVDFVAERGAPILSAAAGVVIYSGYHPQYGNMVEVDHGDGLVTRYAHASKRLVEVGDVVQRGARIATVGSTGRATGAHLHFEVLHEGVPQHPARFLRLPG